jgi:hypothetical protein
MAKSAPAVETEEKERAANGSTPQAQAKALVVIVADELKADGAISADTLEWLNTLAETIADSAVRGLTPEKQLEKAQAERNAIYTRAGVVDGVFAFASETDEINNGKLTVKIENLKRKIAKAKESTDGNAADEQGEQTED